MKPSAPRASQNANFLQKFLTNGPNQPPIVERRSMSTGKLPPLTARPGKTKISLPEKTAQQKNESGSKERLRPSSSSRSPLMTRNSP